MTGAADEVRRPNRVPARALTYLAVKRSGGTRREKLSERRALLGGGHEN
jgi:hypothetical protein